MDFPWFFLEFHGFPWDFRVFPCDFHVFLMVLSDVFRCFLSPLELRRPCRRRFEGAEVHNLPPCAEGSPLVEFRDVCQGQMEVVGASKARFWYGKPWKTMENQWKTEENGLETATDGHF